MDNMQNNYITSGEWVDSSRPAPKPKSPNKYVIILAIEIILIVVLAVANVMVKLPTGSGAPHGGSGSGSVSGLDYSVCKHRTKEDILKIEEDVAKEDAMAIVLKMRSKNSDNCTIEGLLPKQLELKSNEFTQKILYSYDDVSEVPEIAKDSVMGLNARNAEYFQIDETTDYYTIVSVDNSKVACGELDITSSTISCYRGISFNRKHLDYHEKVEGYNHSDEMIFNDLSADFVELVLKIMMATDMWNNSSLYDYYFEDGGDYFMLTGLYFGVGIDMGKLDSATAFDIPYAINIYEKKIKLDKKTKKAAWEKTKTTYGEESSMFNIKSISLSDDDVIEIEAAVYGLSDEEVEELKNQKGEDEMTDAERLDARVTALCGEDYTTVFKGSDNDGIFKCNDYTKGIYSISNSDKEERYYERIAYATYFGTDDDETVNEFFKGKIYIYQDYKHSEINPQLILLLESSSEEALIENNLDAIYNYIKKVNAERNEEMELTVFYTEDLSKTSELKDYIMIAGAAGFNSWMPYGNGFGSYMYDNEETTSLDKIGANPDLYSSQTRSAIKFHRHIHAEIKNGKQITKEALKKLLQNSFENGL